MTRADHRRILAAGLAAALLPVAAVACANVQAAGAPVSLTARSDARIEAVLPAALRGQRIRVTVDGHRQAIVAHPATFSVRGLPGSAAGAWHRLKLQGRATTASARFAVGARSGRRAPTLVLTRATTRVTATAPAAGRP
jgi:hypothetical protein